MAKINVLDKAVAELIAAGEVVERPAAIVKELVENSIDAGATDITVEIKGGGIRMVRVADNGSGIEKDDIPKAFLRHATSKVKIADDLDSILTLGFRGEALASIAAMCKVELTTKTAADTEGTAYLIEGGEFAGTYPAGRPQGTTITVKDIFFNTPARMKFLKRDIGEGNAIAQIVDKCALSHPEVAFRFIRDGQVKLRTSGKGDLLAVINAVYGSEIAEKMLPVDYMFDGNITVKGFVVHPSASRPSRSYQNFFVNNRYVRTRTCSAALEEAYKNKIMTGRFPACVLNVGIVARSVDVNVHPAKIEVRFANEKPIFSAVFFAVKTALSKLESTVFVGKKQDKINMLTMHLDKDIAEQQHISVQELKKLYDKEETQKSAERFSSPVRFNAANLDIYVDDNEANRNSVKSPYRPQTVNTQKFSSSLPDDKSTEVFSAEKAYEVSGFVPENNEQTFYDKVSTGADDIIFGENAIKPPQNATILPQSNLKSYDEPQEKRNTAAEYKLIGELFTTYIILESMDTLILVDKHAAHERIIYEQLIKSLSYGNRQVLMSPLSLTLSKEEYSVVAENIEKLAEIGFLAEDFGGSTVLVREIPIELGESDIANVIIEIAGRLLAGNRDITPESLDKLYYSIACKSAVRSGDRNSELELEEIIRRLEQNPQITHCPHGRPVSVKITRYEIEKMFGRLG